MGFLGGSVVKNLCAKKGTLVQSLGQEDPLEKGMATQWEEFRRQRNLAGYSPWGHKESDMLNDRYFHFQIWRDFQDILNFKRKIQHLLAMEETWV